MSVDRIKASLAQAGQGKKVQAADVDRIMLEARDEGGLDDAERRALQRAASRFDDPTKQRLAKHLSTMRQNNAWVNVDLKGQLASIEGRYASMTVGVVGLSARVGLFDSSLDLKGTAKADGTLKLDVEGKTLSIPVTTGDTAGTILQKVKDSLPPQVTGVLLQGEAKPYDGPASFQGPAATGSDTAAQLLLYKPEALGLRPGETPLRVVVTGYGPFMGVKDNPSATMAERLAQFGAKGAVVEYRRLDVTTEAVDAFIAEMKRTRPDVILSMGVSPDQAQVEERPQNYIAGWRDGNNQPITPRRIREGQPDELPTDLPVDTVERALKPFGFVRNVQTSRSDRGYQPDRSAYLCNYLGYSLASEFGGTDATTAGFMHINPETPVDQMHAVLKALTARQLDWRRAQATPQS